VRKNQEFNVAGTTHVPFEFFGAFFHFVTPELHHLCFISMAITCAAF